MIKGKQQRRFNRKKVQTGSLPTASYANVVSVDATAPSTVAITFDSPVMLGGNGLPTQWKFGTGNHLITAIVSGSGTDWEFTVDGTIAASQPYTIGGADPAARTPLGGYVASDSGTMS